MAVAADVSVVMTVISLIQSLFMKKSKELPCYVDIVRNNNFSVITVHIAINNWLKELRRLGIGRVDTVVEIRILYLEKIIKSTQV